ncbi:16S rRNA (cytidine(1402)-2'-O)-methyltransferase [Imbroritus primus]|uniref:16S rRNA (Cytidine(1402)-2'-O)-methyltransferase n=1 Tax=Imbroritus primus TaxID=3058603 RepID=A0ACD3SNV5_9BURK|nr:16S rRNA (cytidine(1402)-2'-O)-methyltransferase [Burkholderiaceae bacterium PBA]
MNDWNTLAEGQSYPPGTLYVVATPIGNVADLSARALHVLAQADAIACEDTRNTAHLLNRLGLHKPLLAAHQHNEMEAAQHIAARLAAGERIAYVSDAGTPGISDPGAKIVAAARAAGARVMPLPGANAAITALSAAGDLLDAGDGRFTFVGFLSPKAEAREAQLRALAARPEAWILYEAPHRIAATLAALAAVLPGERRILIGRELTKLFEQLVVVRADAASGWLAADAAHAKGEFVLVVEGAGESTAGEAGATLNAQHVLALLLAELPAKRAAKLASAITGVPTDTLYAAALAAKGATP